MEPLEPIHGSCPDYPKNLPLATLFGEVLLAVTDDYHVYVDFSRPEHPLVVRGQSAWGGLHLYRQADGTFSPDGRPFGCLVDSFDPHVGLGKSLCKTARDRLYDAIVHAVTEWAQENGAVFQMAKSARVEADRKALRKEIARLEHELEVRRGELARLERAVTEQVAG